jgi:hypothetical protein
MAASSYFSAAPPNHQHPKTFNLSSLNPFGPSGYSQLPPQGPTAYDPSQSYGYNSRDPALQSNQKSFNNERQHPSTFSKLGRYLSLTLAVSKVFSALFTALLESSMGYIFYKFYSTKHISAGGRSGPWAHNTKLWPTFLLAVASGVTLVLTIASLCILCFSKKARSKNRLYLTVLKYVVHIGTWAAVALFYRLGKTGNDLWGWSCSDEADTIQHLYQNHLNFGKLCSLQVRQSIAMV